MKGYRTLIVNLAVAVFGVLQGADWINLLGSSETAGWIVMAVGFINMGLRAITTTEVGKSK